MLVQDSSEPRASTEPREIRIIYIDGDRVRSLRGIIEHEDDNFLVLRRRDGKVTFAKKYIVRVEDWTGEEQREGEGHD